MRSFRCIKVVRWSYDGHHEITLMGIGRIEESAYVNDCLEWSALNFKLVSTPVISTINLPMMLSAIWEVFIFIWSYDGRTMDFCIEFESCIKKRARRLYLTIQLCPQSWQIACV